ncbi:MAG TPA: ABC transporter ATP-binding protein, partial [Burkholderiaceae bacterium]
PVLLLDEPLSNLDAKLREEMQFELRQIQRKVGTTTVMVTHDQGEALSISDRVVVMQAGRITQADTPLRVYEHPGNQFISTFVGKANLLEGRVVSGGAQRTGVAVGPLHLALGPGDAGLRPGSRVVVGIRPEKLACVALGAGNCDGEVRERFFLGSQWMYRLETSLGQLLVLAANDGTPALEPGARTGLAWHESSVRLVSAEQHETQGLAA